MSWPPSTYIPGSAFLIPHSLYFGLSIIVTIVIFGALSFQKDYDLKVEINDYDIMNKNDHVDTLHKHIHFNYSSIISEPILLSGRTQ